MDIAYASNDAVGGGFAAFIPLLLMGCIFGAFLKSLAKRKDRNQWLWFIAGFAPAIWIIGGIWLASLPEKSLLEEINLLKDKLKKFKPDSDGCQTWSCDCGNINNLSTTNCIECGRKHDYIKKHDIAG